jgi:hypothetical protein
MWRRFFSQRWSLPLLALLGMLMMAPTLNLGLVGDDYVHRALLIGQDTHAHKASMFGLFTFVDGQAAHVQALKESGRLLWWAADNLRLSFWRPLTELTHWLDYQLWPNSPALMHAQSILWYGLLVFLLGTFYRLLDDDPVRTGLATLIYAASGLHLFSVAWLAARNQLVAGCFTLMTLIAYHHWRSGRAAWYGWLAALTLVLGLLSAEAALVTVGYLVAYALVYEQGQPWWPRLRALMPFLLIVVVWRMAYSHMGYGSIGSGSYIDPGAGPWRFVQAMLLRMPTLLLAQLFGVSSAILNKLPQHMQVLYAVLAAGAVLLSVLVAQYFKLWSSALARFCALGAVLALVPVCAAEPNDRLLLCSEIGMSWLFAMLFVKVASHRHDYTGWLALGAKAVVVLMAVVHLAFVPGVTLVSSVLMKKVMTPVTIGEPMSLPISADQTSQHVILLNPPAVVFVYYYPLVRAYFGAANAASTQALSPGNQEIVVSVVDDSTLKLSAARGFIDPMSRDIKRLPFKVGDTVNIGQAAVKVLEVTPDGVPKTALFHFVAPLRGPRWKFLVWKGVGYGAFDLPAQGQEVRLPAADMNKLVMSGFKHH